MKALPKATAILALVVFATLASASAMAEHRGHGHGGNVRFGISLGIPLFGPAYYPAPYYTYPAAAYVYPAPAYGYPAPAYAYPAPVLRAYPPAYVERGIAQAAPAPSQAQGDWYYCAAAKAYYPDVGECPSAWQRVPARPSAR